MHCTYTLCFQYYSFNTIYERLISNSCKHPSKWLWEMFRLYSTSKIGSHNKYSYELLTISVSFCWTNEIHLVLLHIFFNCAHKIYHIYLFSSTSFPKRMLLHTHTFPWTHLIQSSNYKRHCSLLLLRIEYTWYISAGRYFLFVLCDNGGVHPMHRGRREGAHTKRKLGAHPMERRLDSNDTKTL